MLRPIEDRHVWVSVRALFLGSAAILLYTIVIGILNGLTQDEISRARILSHFHAGTIGWVTLSVIATAFWLFASGAVGPGTRRFIRAVVIVGLVAVAGYSVSFWIAFDQGDAAYRLLPAFGIPAALVIWASFGLLVARLRHQDPLTAPHVLMFGALLVTSLGALMGVLLGLGYASGIDAFPDRPDADPLGAHAGPMETYLLLAFTAIAELLLHRGAHGRRSKAAIAQVSLGVASAFLIWASLYLGIAALAPLSLLTMIATFVVFFVRIGWRTFQANPFAGARQAAAFFGGLWIPVYVGLFVMLVFVYFIPGKGDEIPHWLGVAQAHATFVGMGTTLLFAAHGTFGRIASDAGSALEHGGLWIMNIGLLAFIVGELVAERREGGLIMAAGVLITWVAVVWRILKAPHAVAAPAVH